MSDSPDPKEKVLTLKQNRLSLSRNVEPEKIRQKLHGREVTVEVVKKKHRKSTELTGAKEEVSDNKAIETVNEDLQSLGGSLTATEKNARLRVLKKAAEAAALAEQEKEKQAQEAMILAEQKKAEEERLQEEARQAALLETQPKGIEKEPLQEAEGSRMTQEQASASAKESVKPIAEPTTMFAKIHETEKVKEKGESLEKLFEGDEDEFRGDRRGASKGKVVAVEDKKRGAKSEVKAPQVKHKWEEGRRFNSRINVNAINNSLEDEMERVRSLASIKRARARAKNQDKRPEAEKIVRDVILPEVITVQELASRMAERSTDVIRELMKKGMTVTANQTIDADTAELVAMIFGHKVKRVAESDVENVLKKASGDTATLEVRAPVVTVMGHVDHGKTSLLDALRSTDIAAGEAGGITQHIGAYQVTLESKQRITFLDTPGHEAFTAMRARGSKVTDIVILVVAADDGIMAQTVEAINHAKAAEVPIIVAINKIDKPGANPTRVKEELLIHGLVPEDLGGDIMVVEVSAKMRIGLDKLMEAILLQSEMLELKACVDRAASGTVLEARIDRHKGVVATLLVQDGTLNIGDILVAGSAVGKVRALTDHKGTNLDHALPSMPVELLGLDTPPQPGDQFDVVENEKDAREISEFRQRKERALRAASMHRGSLEELFSKAAADGKQKELNIIIKADVNGSAEALTASVTKLSNDTTKVKVLHSGVGAISESDIALARASNALIFGFNVRANAKAKELADKEKINIAYYSIIYNLLDDLKLILEGMMIPEIKEVYLGLAEVRQIFNLSKYGKVAGCMVVNGVIKRGASVRLIRDNIVIHEGKLRTLRRFKDDVKEVKESFECGIALENYEDIREKDVIEAFELVEQKVTLS